MPFGLGAGELIGRKERIDHRVAGELSRTTDHGGRRAVRREVDVLPVHGRGVRCFLRSGAASQDYRHRHYRRQNGVDLEKIAAGVDLRVPSDVELLSRQVTT